MCSMGKLIGIRQSIDLLIKFKNMNGSFNRKALSAFIVKKGLVF